MKANYTDEATGLTVQISSDDSWSITRPPLEPNLQPTVMMTGRAQPAVPAVEAVSAQEQIDAFLKQYAVEHRVGEPLVKLPVAEPVRDDLSESLPESSPLKGRLPDDFPSLSVLHAADPPINTYGQLAKFADDYTQIPGIGPERAVKIAEAVG